MRLCSSLLLCFLFLVPIARAGDVAVKIVELRETMGVEGLDFSPDGKHLAATSEGDSDEVHVWDWQGSRSIVLKMKKGGGSAGPASEPLRYRPDGRFLLACHGRAEKDTVIHIWDARTGDFAQSIVEPDGGNCYAIGITPDGKQLIRITETGLKPKDSFIVYNTTDWQPAWSLRTIPFHPKTLTVSPDGKFAAVGGENLGPGIPNQPQILIIDLLKRAIVRTIDAFPLDNRVNQLAWHPDGIHIAAGATVGGTFKGPDIVKVFDATNGNLIVGEPVESPAHIFAMRYSPNGKYFVESSVNRSIRIWDGQHKTQLQEIHGEAESLAISADSRFLARGGDRKLLIWKTW